MENIKNYIDLGIILGTISYPLIIYLLIKSGHLTADVKLWWNGGKFNLEYICQEISLLMVVTLILSLVMVLLYPLAILLYVLYVIVKPIRDDRLKRIGLIKK